MKTENIQRTMQTPRRGAAKTAAVRSAGKGGPVHPFGEDRLPIIKLTAGKGGPTHPSMMAPGQDGPTHSSMMAPGKGGPIKPSTSGKGGPVKPGLEKSGLSVLESSRDILDALEGWNIGMGRQ